MNRILFAMAFGALFSAVLTSCDSSLKYPETRKDEVADDYFGTQVLDPYRWLENDTAAEVREWVQKENAVTQKYLDRIPFRQSVRNRLEALMNYDVESTPWFTGKYYLFSKKSGLSNQSVLYIKDSLNGEARVLLDPNTFSADGTVALAGTSVSHDSKYIAYLVADGGSDWRTIYVMDLATGQKLADEIKWAKFTSIAWQGNGFYYSCYTAPVEGKELSVKNEFHKVYYHTLGQPQSSDRLVFENKEEPLRNFSALVTDDEKYLIVSETEGTDGISMWVKNLKVEKADFTHVTTGFDYDYSVIGNVGDDLYVYTNYKAPKYKLIRINMDRSDIGSWEDVLPEQKDVLSGATLAGGHLVATYMVDVASRMSVYSLQGELVRDIDLGVLGSAGYVSGRMEDDLAFFSYTSYTVPSVIYQYQVSTGEMKEIFRPKVDFDFDKYKVDRVFYKSHDGTEIPMFIVCRKDLQLNGKNPTLLYGYGGFNISLTPYFSSSRLAWLEQGGVYAVACIRGGGEYGERWHLAGTKLNKQNVFDDFIAAAEYLEAEKYTSPHYLAIQGGSNGGLLIGAVVNQKPELFGVAFPEVGVMDMLRYQHFTIGWAWAGDYGTSDDEQQFHNLYAYSPIHNIKPGSNYPAILVTTADHDDRVVPAHSFKYIATLQELQPHGAPKLIRVETRAGHGAGKPTSLIISELADIYSFAFYNMGVVPVY